MVGNSILWPREQSRYSSDAAIDLFLDEGKVKIVSSLDEFELPDNPTWAENPFGSRIWQLYYQSLGWLYAGEAAYKAGEFAGFPQYAKTMLMDFLATNDDPTQPTDPMSWHDGGTAFRLATISYLYENYIKFGNPNGTVVTFSAAEQDLFAQGLQNHLDQMQFRLSQVDKYEESNHRFFHGMALLSYATVFGKAEGTPYYEPNADLYVEQGLDVINEILGNIINLDTGVTKEQSFTYQRLDMGLVIEAQEYIVDNGYALDHDLNAVMEKMLEFDVLSRRPGNQISDEYISEIGDTAFGTRAGTYYTDIVEDKGLISPYAKYALTKGTEGIRPPDLIDYHESGYIIYRPEYEWENIRDTRVIMDVSEKTISHGHYDNTNILMSSFGERILVDSGGPYSYDRKNDFGYADSFRSLYFITSKAHNVVVVDGQNVNVDTQVLSILDNDVFSFTSAKHRGFAGVDIYRNLFVLKDSGIVLVFDVADNLNGALHEYDLNWHFDPSAIGVDAGSTTEFKVGNVHVDGAFLTGTTAGYEVISGRAGPDPQGWVTTALYNATPAPVLDISQTTGLDTWFISAFATSLNQSPALLLNATKTAGGFTSSLQFDGVTYNITINNGVPTVIQNGDAPDANTLRGDNFANRITGTDANNIMYGEGGDDNLYGLGGNDNLIGGTGDDRINGGTGKDTLEGGIGNDLLNGDTDDDSILGGDGVDNLYGGQGNDSIDGGSGNDVLQGEEGNDSLIGALGDDKLRGGMGNDVLKGASGNDEMHGEAGNDTLQGGEGDDRLNGGDGDDRFIDDVGNDLVVGGVGNDIFYMGEGADRYYGDVGIDIAVFTGTKTQYLYEDRGTYVVVMDRFLTDGDTGRDYFYDVDIFRFTDGDILHA